ncbi:DUF4124 domain-containing protein [Woeseia oceani]|uniref:DUF4124 domain-containing protein n=1 Tax=Woeseia oceani TaxID=1548547 RepID=A0A193LC05_9GAMM|nr:DUF4124 domain-containing protein [Woeseia oceani]ANO49966.1 hypothetical protein BA177_00885 [Woeseia oceani]
MSADFHRIFYVSLLSVLFASGAAAGEIYKWTDAAGNVHYGDRPAENAAAERLNIQSRPTDPDRIAALAQARIEARSEAREQAEATGAGTDDDKPSPAEQRRIAEERAQQCATYKERLQSFLQSRRLYREDEDGERIYLSEQETLAARENVQSKVEEYCSP